MRSMTTDVILVALALWRRRANAFWWAWRGQYLQRRGDALLIMPDFLRGGNLLSLILGQLVIRSHKRLRWELRLQSSDCT